MTDQNKTEETSLANFLKFIRERRGEDHGVDPEEVAKELEEEEELDEEELEKRYE